VLNVRAAKNRRAKTKEGKKTRVTRKKKDVSKTAVQKKPARLSAATLKTRMSPAMLQNPIARRKIWTNLMQMMTRRGYEWVSDRPQPTEYEQLWPNNKGFLGFFHMYAVDKNTDPSTKREPVHVIFCSKAGEPTLKSLQYPSKHIILVSDSLTGRCRAALSALNTKAPPMANAPIVKVSATEKQLNVELDLDQDTKDSKEAKDEKQVKKKSGTNKVKDAALSVVAASVSGIELKDVYVEAFVSTYFMFDLLRQRYLKVVQFSATDNAEMDKVFDVYERKRDLTRFPKMLDTDPVVRHLRLPLGSVITQTRLSTASGIHKSYRYIVRPNADYKTT